MSEVERTGIWAAIERERDYQDGKYGTPGERILSVRSYWLIAALELAEVEKATSEGDDQHALAEVLQVAAVCVACLERHGVVERGEVVSDDKR